MPTDEKDASRSGKMRAEVDRKEKECEKATTLSPNPDEAVEKNLVKSSKDEAKPRPE